ncbi:hypothetical protein Tco_1174954 [Tanacetum coccineum]
MEKSQPELIYKVYLAILKQFSFFNAFIRTVDAPDIYMQQFWHTVTYDLKAKTYFFTLDDEIFEVNADLLCEALHITPKVSNHTFVEPPSEQEIISFIKKLGYSESLTKISDIAINNMYQPWRTFMIMINKCLTGKASGFDRPRLALLQENKSQKEGVATLLKIHKAHNQTYPLLEQPHIQGTPMLPPCDEIKASDDYMNYLVKSLGIKPVKSQGKGLLTTKGVEVAVETIRVPNKRRSKIMIKETSQSEDVADTVDYEETEEDDETPLIRRRQTGVVISSGVHQETNEEALDHSKKLKGIEECEGSGMAPEVHDGPSGSSTSSSSKYEDAIEDISVEKPAEQLLSSSHTLSSDEYGNQFINDNPDVSINDVLKEPVKAEIQSIVEVPVLQEKPADQRPPLVDTTKLERKVDAMLKNDHIEAIDKSVQAHLKNILPKHVPKYSTKPFDEASLKEYDLKDKLIKLMIKYKYSFQSEEGKNQSIDKTKCDVWETKPHTTTSTEVPTANMIVMTSMTKLESLFGPLFDKYSNGENQVVLKSSAVTTTDTSDKHQQQQQLDSTSSTLNLATTVTADGNFDLYISLFFSLF